MEKVKTVALGKKELLKTDYGPVSFGLVINAALVSWFGKYHKDLLISRCWEGIYLYPTGNLGADELVGEPVKIHNRVSPAAVDLNNDGLEDLIVAGASYQLGIKTDPCPGGGIYYIINKGVDGSGVPILEPVKKLPVRGRDIEININNMVEVQVVDIDNDMKDEVIAGSTSDWYKGWIYKLSTDPLEIVYDDKMLQKFDPLGHIIDIDGDGKPEYVFAGGEPGVGHYCKIITL